MQNYLLLGSLLFAAGTLLGIPHGLSKRRGNVLNRKYGTEWIVGSPAIIGERSIEVMEKELLNNGCLCRCKCCMPAIYKIIHRKYLQCRQRGRYTPFCVFLFHYFPLFLAEERTMRRMLRTSFRRPAYSQLICDSDELWGFNELSTETLDKAVDGCGINTLCQILLFTKKRVLFALASEVDEPTGESKSSLEFSCRHTLMGSSALLFRTTEEKAFTALNGFVA